MYFDFVLDADMAFLDQYIFDELTENGTIGELIDRVSTRLGGELWFRGESDNFPTPCMPATAREPTWDTRPITPDYSDGTYGFPLRALTIEEDDIVKKLQESPPHDPYFPKLLQKPDHPGWLALARHHSYPTRLLDVTWDLGVAAFFACAHHPASPGYVFAFSQIWDPEKNRRSKADHYRDIFDASLGDTIPSYRDHDANFPGTLKQHAHQLERENDSPRMKMKYLFRCDDVINERMIAQRGAFLWQKDVRDSLFDSGRNVFVFKIPSAAKQNILNQLQRLGVTAESLRLPKDF